jgi:hypothetical protein
VANLFYACEIFTIVFGGFLLILRILMLLERLWIKQPLPVRDSAALAHNKARYEEGEILSPIERWWIKYSPPEIQEAWVNGDHKKALSMLDNHLARGGRP